MVDPSAGTPALTTGMSRKVDDLGRIVLPVEMRRLFGIRAGDELEIAVDSGSILLRKLEVSCVFCGGGEGLRAYREKQVCGPCARDLGTPQPEGDLVHPPLGDSQLSGDGG